ncbi:MAG: prepilin-type N-terminal cleavage/methylation domain-containing protein [Acidimicrobiia bacterium]|nr:prepilin-type N-terminal cleavage/methylation domain-containing protein [Acidimicrobiia bacterium]
MHLIRLHRADDGVTLTELMVALFLMVIVAAVFLPTMISGMNATGQITNVARSNDNGRLALQRIDRELRAAEVICTPAPGDAPGDTLRLITRAYTAASTPTGTRDITYSLNGTNLEKSTDGGATWTPVVEGVVNATVVDDDYNTAHTLPVGTIGVPLFTNDQEAGYPSYGKVITVRLWLDESATDHISPILLTTELSGRNIWVPNGPGC